MMVERRFEPEISGIERVEPMNLDFGSHNFFRLKAIFAVGRIGQNNQSARTIQMGQCREQ